MTQIVYSPRYQRELKKVVERIASDNVSAANEFVDQLEHFCLLLSTAPAMGRLRPEIGHGVRYIGYGNYLVFYRWFAEQDRVVILSVWHGRRRLPRLR